MTGPIQNIHWVIKKSVYLHYLCVFSFTLLLFWVRHRFCSVNCEAVVFRLLKGYIVESIKIWQMFKLLELVFNNSEHDLNKIVQAMHYKGTSVQCSTSQKQALHAVV